MANNIYSVSWWGTGIYNSINWGIIYSNYASNFLKLENSELLLQENGDKIIL